MQLLGHDADIDAQDRTGWTALMHGVKVNSFDTVNVLIKNKANINLKGNDKNTALMIASNNGDYRIVKSLLDG